MLDYIIENLTMLVDKGETEEIKEAAKSYLYFYRAGDLGSNSPGLMIFLMDPVKYTKEFRSEVLGVL